MSTHVCDMFVRCDKLAPQMTINEYCLRMYVFIYGPFVGCRHMLVICGHLSMAYNYLLVILVKKRRSRVIQCCKVV